MGASEPRSMLTPQRESKKQMGRSRNHQVFILLVLGGLLFVVSGCTGSQLLVAQTTSKAEANSPVPATVTPSPDPALPAAMMTPVAITTAPAQEYPVFDGERALADVAYQVNLGPRTPGSEAHSQTMDWMMRSAREAGWSVSLQEGRSQEQPAGYSLRNVIASYGSGRPWLVLGAHYDSRLLADKDPDPALQALGVPGANDGASGVAVLLELARILPAYLDQPPAGSNLRFKQITLVFFDAEDNGKLPGWNWILGSRYYVENLAELPDAAVILDMVGDAALNIPQEKNSDAQLVQQIWQTAAELGYQQVFLPEFGPGILDDHTPFLQAGVPALDIIDYDYPYWHTSQDTLDKVSAQSLQIVGETVLAWLVRQ